MSSRFHLHHELMGCDYGSYPSTSFFRSLFLREFGGITKGLDEEGYLLVDELTTLD